MEEAKDCRPRSSLPIKSNEPGLLPRQKKGEISKEREGRKSELDPESQLIFQSNVSSPHKKKTKYWSGPGLWNPLGVNK